MKNILLLFSIMTLAACSPNNDQGAESQDKPIVATQLSLEPWSYDNPMDKEPDFSVTHETQKLEFFGWSTDDDATITMEFPESTTDYNRAILEYRMGGWNEGPAEWDMTTQIMIIDKLSGEQYEIARAFTPYGNSFGSDWSKIFYIDVTEYLPMLTGTTEFKVHYGGFDATETRAHTVTLTFDLYKNSQQARPRPIYSAKLYDSRHDDNKMRGWYYGSSLYPIEGDKWLGLRNVTIPKDVNILLMRVCITGHGMEQGKFPDREDYMTKNAAEFDENTYEVMINGKNMGTGKIFYNNKNTYFQAGTYRTNRANWGPGLPANTHYWLIENIPSDREMTFDLNLERYISPEEKGKAYYIIQVDLFGN